MYDKIKIELRLKNIKENVKKLVENNNFLIKNSIENDIDGYLYCLTNNIFNVYNIEIYKICIGIKQDFETKSQYPVRSL